MRSPGLDSCCRQHEVPSSSLQTCPRVHSMNPTLSSLRNEALPYQRVSSFERPSKRPRQNSIVHAREQNAPPPNDLQVQHRRLPYGGSPFPPRPSMSQNRVTISSLLSMRPPGSPPFLEKVQLPKVHEVLSASVEGKNGTCSETLSPLSLVCSPKIKAKTHIHAEKELSTSPISTHYGIKKDSPTLRVVPKLPGPGMHASAGAKRKVIPCPYEFCQKKFSRNSNLKVHMRIHTKTYPFACNLCEREFMWSSSLHWHTKWHEKVAMREAAKFKNGDGLEVNSAMGNGQGCTCACVCPVHKTKPVAGGGNPFDSQKLQALKSQFDVPSSQ